MIEVIKPGLLTTIQDLGRPGYAHLGVTRSGALDAPALVRANRLVGNPDHAAGLETTLTGVRLRARAATVAAVTGATASVTVDGVAAEFATPIPVPEGAVLEVGPAQAGVRSYVAFAGGVAVPPVLGSRATDTLSGLGPPPLRAGAVLPLGPATAGATDVASAVTPDTEDHSKITVRVGMGPRFDWLSLPAREALLTEPYTLSVKSNRVGARLTGPALTRAVTDELPSEGIVLGAVQVPPDGQPLVFLADHPTTGGYPIVAVVEQADVALLAQARPGTIVRFAGWT